MNENPDSIHIANDIFTPIYKIAENTEPINLVNWDLNWWSFSIALFSFIAGTIAAVYSYRGYKFQRISAERLEKLIPGQINYFEVVCCIINNILDIETVFFSRDSYKKYPLNLILSLSKLPDDLINLDKYEKNQTCYEEAFKIKIAWRNYNIFIEELINNANGHNEFEIRSYAQYLITLSKSYIRLIQRFEALLAKHSYLHNIASTNERIAYFILDRFFEGIDDISDLVNTGQLSFQCERINYNKENKDLYTSGAYLPNFIDIDVYLNSHHSTRLDSFYDKNDFNPIKNIYLKLKNGEYDYMKQLFHLPSNIDISSIDFHYFKYAYFVYIEPVLIGIKRYEYASLLKNS